MAAASLRTTPATNVGESLSVQGVPSHVTACAHVSVLLGNCTEGKARPGKARDVTSFLVLRAVLRAHLLPQVPGGLQRPPPPRKDAGWTRPTGVWLRVA